ncbi:hypothetical protein A6X21_17730 [Planctopirus hydrillae]|uniref:Uncharacterized protein n=1 Tax=Planctopirus hydrillae TaxID=1841610 RepID=A0A1C3ELV2_9PLAN|nr:hypothetical protein A6X21_17730 [Planctopirus hydrillae]
MPFAELRGRFPGFGPFTLIVTVTVSGLDTKIDAMTETPILLAPRRRFHRQFQVAYGNRERCFSIEMRTGRYDGLYGQTLGLST